MQTVKIQNSAALRIGEIYRYSVKNWGEKQAKIYISELIKAFDNIKNNAVSSYPIPAEFGVNGFYFRYQKHFVYWKYLDNGNIGIVTILHARMHQMKQFRDTK